VPRRTRPKKRRGRAAADASEEEPVMRAPDVVRHAPPGWQVRIIQPAAAIKEYRCPGCNHEIRPKTKHVVAWREDAEDLRRHWHTPCWERSAGDR
jgi:hypothetical protein